MKIALFDMDDTILLGRFIDTAAQKFSFEDDLESIRNLEMDAFQRTSKISELIRGRTMQELLEVINNIPLIEDAVDSIKEIKNRGYAIGLVSDSYDVIVKEVGKKVDADFCFANILEMESGKTTGKVHIPDYFLIRPDSNCQHEICKGHLITKLINEKGIAKNHIIAIGDSENDICMIKNAGLGISFCSSCEELNSNAQFQITKKSFAELIDRIKEIDK